MRALSASNLLNAWERGSRQPPVERALLLLGAACPEQTPEELAQLSIGRRDSLLLDLRERTFGSQFVSRLICQKCGEQLELAFKVSDIEVAEEVNDALTLNRDGFEVMFRLPNSEDVRAALVASCEREQLLLQRCVLCVSKDGVEQSAAELPSVVVEMVVDRMARADPQSVPLSLVCAACSHKWFMGFDIVSYFWSELNSWASRMLREVHLLASTYGWREIDILAMNPWRRQSYLEMIGK
ncbi:MAG TPA: hypothetical protein VN844_07040 [Pyrinomonadaceae bacterium]|nr:hypothetical protein [Pyrinomonadaceae bacterium]